MASENAINSLEADKSVTQCLCNSILCAVCAISSSGLISIVLTMVFNLRGSRLLPCLRRKNLSVAGTIYFGIAFFFFHYSFSTDFCCFPLYLYLCTCTYTNSIPAVLELWTKPLCQAPYSSIELCGLLDGSDKPRPSESRDTHPDLPPR